MIEEAGQGVLAWHWCRSDRRLELGHGQVIHAGGVYEVDGPVALGVRGLHGSRSAMQALGYASGHVICRVRLSGEVHEGTDKLAASRREVLWWADGASTLHRFAIWCADTSLARHEARGSRLDPRLREALAVKLRWLDGTASRNLVAELWAAARDVDRDGAKIPAWTEALDEPCDAARAAAWASAWEAAWTDAWSAVRDAAWGAARGVSWDPTREDSWNAAWEAGEVGCARDMTWDAVRDAAWTSGWGAARAAQADELERRLLALAPV